jgi:pimeloyl-ACP methyl ester carboxylesterase
MVDKENIAVIGHSLGGSAALCMGRQRDDIKAVIALESPYMCDILGVDEQGFVFEQNIYPIPVLNIYSDSTWDHLSSWPQYKQNHAFLSEISSDIENVHMSGAGHFSLTDLSLLSPLLTRTLDGFESTKDYKEILESINMICLEFLDKHLK